MMLRTLLIASLCLALLGFLPFPPVSTAAVQDPVPGSAQESRAGAAQPGGIFVTGHDSDFHAAYTPENFLGARHIIQRAIAYVTYGKASPKILLVTDLRSPLFDEGDPRLGMKAAGFTVFDVADYGSGAAGILSLQTVNFANYDVVVVASDVGGWLHQDELDVLNARSAQLMAFVNNGGGLVAFNESGSRDTTWGAYPGTSHDRFAFIAPRVASVPNNRVEVGNTVTAVGVAMGLTNSDVNGNVSHAVFVPNGIMEAADMDPEGRIISLATRGRPVGLYNILGRVTIGGGPLPGVLVSAGAGHQALSDPQGYYTITNVSTGSYTLTPLNTCYVFTPPQRTASVPPDAQGQNFAATPASGATCVNLTGPTRGPLGVPQTFMASVEPKPATPVTYVWTATGLPPVTHTGVPGNSADAVQFTWLTPGLKTVGVTAKVAGNPDRTATLSYTAFGYLYLPIVNRKP